MAPDTQTRLRSLSKLTVIDQIIIQCFCIDIKNNNPKFGLITEQMSSYIQRILVGRRDQKRPKETKMEIER